MVVTFEQPERARWHAQHVELPGPLLIDGQRRLYRHYGMARAAKWTVMQPAIWGQYLKYIWQGRRLRMPQDDIQQLGGDVLIDPQGIVRWTYRSKTPIDRPAIDALLSAVDAGRSV